MWRCFFFFFFFFFCVFSLCLALLHALSCKHLVGLHVFVDVAKPTGLAAAWRHFRRPGQNAELCLCFVSCSCCCSCSCSCSVFLFWFLFVLFLLSYLVCWSVLLLLDSRCAPTHSRNVHLRGTRRITCALQRLTASRPKPFSTCLSLRMAASC